MTRPVVMISIGKMHYRRMMSEAAWARLAEFAEIRERDGDEPATKADLLRLLPGADAIITSWDVARLDSDVIAAAPSLWHGSANIQNCPCITRRFGGAR